MKTLDALLTLLFPTLILIHLFVAPYTKVEESFNIQAVHDIVNYGFPTQNITTFFKGTYDHFSFPGAVPRTFVGALALSNLYPPNLGGSQYGQLVARGVLGMFNAIALLTYKNGLDGAFGKDVGRWYTILQATQFHVIFYASRTLPNMFAFGLTTFALRQFLPIPPPQVADDVQMKQKLGIFLFVFSGVVFRSETAILLFTQLGYMLAVHRISLQTIVPAGLSSALLTIVVSVGLDSYFWQKLVWPELAGFYFNAIQGKSEEWGTSPLTHYFADLLPKLLLNPLILALLIPLAFLFPATKYPARELVIPSVLFVAIYSLQPHKESRFIIYVTPTLTAAASLSASYIWTRRSKSLLYRGGSLLLLASVAGSFIASTGMLLISSLNYPGGEALAQLHSIIKSTEWPVTQESSEYRNISIHMDVLSCMTGVTRFQEFPWRELSPSDLPVINNQPTQFWYDKTENETRLLEPDFWQQFDYALMEEPEKAIGKWEVIGTVFAYSGIEVLRPGSVNGLDEAEVVYAANNISKKKGVMGSKDIREAVAEGVNVETTKGKDIRSSLIELKTNLLAGELTKTEFVWTLRDLVRSYSGGWWVGPRMQPKIRILKRV